MTVASNQYASKVFADHPIALWSLDEQAYYLSLIDDNNRLFSTWTLTGCTASDTPTLPADPSPFSDNIYSSVTKSTTGAGTITIESPAIFDLTEIDSATSTFNVNFFLYQNPTFINWFKVGIRYNNAGAVPQEEISGTIAPPTSSSWINFNTTYNVPTSWSGGLKIFIQVDFANSAAGDAASRTVIMNGLSVGQGSQTTCYDSLGSTAVTIPTELGLTTMTGISADQYGMLSDNGYYLVRNNRLLAHNRSMPIIYGTDHSTQIVSSDVGLPSLIFPGKGMLHESGRNKFYTFEMWLKIDPATSSALRILGPLDTNDGLFVKEGFLTLSINGEIGSHFVGEWYRPMLVHISFRDRNATVMINGEQVISIPFDRKTIDLPDTNDWWAFYSYPAINFFAIDCIAVYPYLVPEAVAKRRFIYGQGTPSIQSIDNAYHGEPTVVEFATAQYDASVIYPDIARWDAGYFNNMTATRDYLSVPNYQLPQIFLSGRDTQEWYDDNLVVNDLEYPANDHPNFVTFRPNVVAGSWNYTGINYQDPSYFNFPTLNILNDQIAAVYGVFEVESSIATDRPLMSFVNVTNGDTFDIKVNASTVTYSLNGTTLHTDTITIGTENAVGINFAKAGVAFGYNVSRFFSSPSSIQLYVGGDGVTTFEGKIYGVGFCNPTNYSKISDNFNASGIALFANYAIFLDHFASYTLLPEYEYGKLYLDIAVQSEWEEYFPLSYFASYVKDENGDALYDLDMLQLNIGYSTVVSSSVWTYADLKAEFPTPNDYADLRDSVYLDYFGLKKRNASGSTATSKSSLKSYISFQSLASGANTPLDAIPYAKDLSDNNVIYPDLENTVPLPTKAYQTKFAFKDDTIVFPPKSQPFEDYAMVVHLEINQRSILKNPLKLKSLEISAKNMNEDSLTADPSQRVFIGTKFGKKIYPVVSVSGDEGYKAQNPFAIYKTSTPYLYTTKKSGIRVVQESNLVSTGTERYAFIPVNEAGSFDYKLSAMQFMVRPDFLEDDEEVKFIEVRHKDGYLLYTLDKIGGVATVQSYSSDPLATPVYTDIAGNEFYQNGRYVSAPFLDNNEWAMIGISFPYQLDFSEYSGGGIRVYGGSTVNNVSYFLSDGLGIKTSLVTRTWQQVFDRDGVVPAGTAWSYWNGFTWQEVYLLGQTSSSISTPANIFDAYAGTNSEIVDDGYGLTMAHRNAQIVSNATWDTFSLKPA